MHRLGVCPERQTRKSGVLSQRRCQHDFSGGTRAVHALTAYARAGLFRPFASMCCAVTSFLCQHMLRRVEATWRASLANRHRRITHRRHQSRHRRRLAHRIRQAPQDANPLRNPGALPAETTAPSTQSEATRTAGNSAARLVRPENSSHRGDYGQEIFSVSSM